MAKEKQKNFRMSARAVQILKSLSKARGISETEVMEQCLAQLAGSLNIEFESAKELLLEHFGRMLAKGPQMRDGAAPGQAFENLHERIHFRAI